MAWGHQFKIRIGVVLFIEGKLLLVRQNNRPFWVLPGGTLELGEGIEETAIREMQEETGLTVEILAPLYLGDFIKQVGSEAESEARIEQTLDIVFLARHCAGAAVMARDENLDAMAFCERDETASLDIKPDALKVALLRDWHRLENGADWQAGQARDNTARERCSEGYTKGIISVDDKHQNKREQNATLHACSNFIAYLGKYR